MKTLIDIFRHLKSGDSVLFQLIDDKGNYGKPELVTIVGIDVWDMAAAVYYVPFKKFVNVGSMENIEVESFGEWMEFWNILGHWKTVPKFRNLLKAYRKQKI